MRWRAGPGPFLTVLTGPPAGGGVACGSSRGGEPGGGEEEPDARGNICREIHAHKGPKAGKTNVWLQKSGKGFPLVAGDRGSRAAPGSL